MIRSGRATSFSTVSLRGSSNRVSLRWVVLAWLLFRSSTALWIAPATVLTAALLLCGLLATGHLYPAALPILSLMHVSGQPLLPQLPIFPQLPASLQPDKIIVPLASLLLLLLALAANTAMTGMANRAVRGGAISVRDLFRFGGFGATSLVLGTTLLAAAAGSLVLFVGSIAALGLLLAAQSAAVRTRRFLPALRASSAVIRSDPARTLALAAFVLLALMLGIATGGLGLLAAIPVVKIVGAFADVFAEAHEEQQNQGQQNQGQQNQGQQNQGWSGKHSAALDALASPASTFTWTQDEEMILRRTAPPVSLSHLAAAGLVILLSAYLFLPEMPAANVRSEDAARPESIASDPQPATVPPREPIASSPQPDAGASASPKPADGIPADGVSADGVSADGIPTALASAVPISSYDPDNPPTLPCRMQWGNYTVLIEEENSGDGNPPKKISVLDAAGIPVYTIADDQIGEVRVVPLLGGPQPELLVRTEEGGDGVNGIHMALTQQGSVHTVFFLQGQYAVRTLPLSSGANGKSDAAGGKSDAAGTVAAGEGIVVDTPLDVPLSDIHHYPLLTSTYRWNGREFENATQSLRGPTDQRLAQYEQDLVAPASLEEAERTTVGLLANMNLLGMTSLPTSLVRSSGFQSGIAWLRANPQSQQSVSQAIADAKKSLPNVSGNATSSDSSQSDSSQSGTP